MLTRQVIYSLLFRQPALKLLFWISLSSFGFHRSWAHAFTASNCPERRSWQDIHHWELKVLVEPETWPCLNLSPAYVHTIQNLINLRQTCALVESLCFPNGSICTHPLWALGSYVIIIDWSIFSHVDKSLILYQPCTSNIQRRLQDILGSWKAHLLSLIKFSLIVFWFIHSLFAEKCWIDLFMTTTVRT